MKRFAYFAGVFAGLFSIVVSLEIVSHVRPLAEFEAPPVELVLALCTIALVIGWITRAVLLAAYVLVHRGPNAISWAPPQACDGLVAWFCAEWDTAGSSGRQEGFRLLGFEVAIAGTFSPR